MTLEEFKLQITRAATSGKLMTPKHDPKRLDTAYRSFRTVLTHELAANLENFINGGQYTVTEYENKKFQQSPQYFVIKPNPESKFYIPASGVLKAYVFGSTLVDSLVVVSGQLQGWHVFGEDSSVIESKLANGDLLEKGVLF